MIARRRFLVGSLASAALSDAGREQVDWDRLRADTAQNDFAVAFLVLSDRLGITA